MNVYQSQLERFDKKAKVDVENPRELIKELEEEFNKTVYKTGKRNSKNNRASSNNNFDTEKAENNIKRQEFVGSDLEKIRKNNKLLELIMVNKI